MLVLLLAAAAVQAADSDPPRLKYRSRGPVCACESGMGENEIRKAWEARFGAGTQRPATGATQPGGGPAVSRQDSGKRDQQGGEADETKAR